MEKPSDLDAGRDGQRQRRVDAGADGGQRGRDRHVDQDGDPQDRRQGEEHEKPGGDTRRPRPGSG